MIGVEAGGHGIETGQHAASLTGGAPGVLHGNRTYLLQDDDGQIPDAHSISAGLDYPGIGPEHAWLHDIGRVEYVSITDDEALDAFQLLHAGSKASSRRSSRRMRWRMSPKIAPPLPHGPSARDEPVRPRRQGHLHRRRRSRGQAVSATGIDRGASPRSRARGPRRARHLSDRRRSRRRDLRPAARRRCREAGADLIEIGMPFSDPMADGPAIQAAGQRALKAGMTLARDAGDRPRLPRARRRRRPIVLMGYYNPIYRYGAERFLADAGGRRASTGSSSSICRPRRMTSWPCRRAPPGLDFIRLATPTSDDARLPAVLDARQRLRLLRLDRRHHRHQLGRRRRACAARGRAAAPPFTAADRGRLRHPHAGAGRRGRARRRRRRRRHGARRARRGAISTPTARPSPASSTPCSPTSRRSPPACAARAARRRRRRKADAMNWLTNFVLPKIRAVVAKKEVPDNLWQQMPELRADAVPPRARGQSRRLPQLRPSPAPRPRAAARAAVRRRRITTAIELPKPVADPLKFRDRKRYTDRLKEAQAKSGATRDALVVAHGTIGGIAAVVAAFDFAFMGGSMGIAVGEGLARRGAARRAAARRR